MKIKTIIVLFCCGLLLVRQVQNYVMNGHWQFLYYHVVNIQDFSKKHNYLFFPKLYKSEVEKYLSFAIPQAKKDMDTVLIKANKLYDDYTNKPSKNLSSEVLSDKLYESELQLKLEIELKIYIDLLKITDKYLLIPFGPLPTDWIGNWAECFMPYFEKYNIDDSGLIELGNYLDIKLKELNMIEEKFNN